MNNEDFIKKMHENVKKTLDITKESQDIIKKILDDLKRLEMQEEFSNEEKKVTLSEAVMESMVSAFRESEEIDKKIDEKNKEEAEGQKRLEQYRKEHEPDINKYIIEFIDCELDIISGFEISGYEKKELEEFEKKIEDEKNKINNKGGLSKLFSKNKDREIEEKIAQLNKEKQNKFETIKEIHIKDDAENKKRRNEILEKISSHSKGFEGLSILSDLFEGYSEQLSENKEDLSDKMKEKSNMTSQEQLLIKQSDEIESVRKLVLDKIIERSEEDIESTVGSSTKKIVKQSIGELSNTKAVMQYQDFKTALKDRQKINGHTIKSDEEIRQQFERL